MSKLLLLIITSDNAKDSAASMASAEALGQSMAPWEGVTVYEDGLEDAVWDPVLMRLSTSPDVSHLCFSQRLLLATGKASNRVLMDLAKDTDMLIRNRVAQNRKAPHQALMLLASESPDDSYIILRSLLENDSSSEKVLEIMADSLSKAKRYRLLESLVTHPNVTPAILHRLLQSDDQDVREVAAMTQNGVASS